MEWIYDEGVPLTKKADIELGIVVHKQIEDMDGETFTFTFSASKEELQKNTVHLNLNQVISLDKYFLFLAAKILVWIFSAAFFSRQFFLQIFSVFRVKNDDIYLYFFQ